MEENPINSFLSLIATFVNVSAVEYCRLLTKTPTFVLYLPNPTGTICGSEVQKEILYA